MNNKHNKRKKLEAWRQFFFCVHLGGLSLRNMFSIVIQLNINLGRKLKQIHQVIVDFMHNDIHRLKINPSKHSICNS